MELKAVLFDLDNTLYDYDHAHKKAIKEVFHVFRKEVHISQTKFDQLFKISRKEIHRELAGTASAHNRVLYFQRLIEKTHRTVEPFLVLKLYNSYWNNLLSNMKLRPGAVEVLKYCKDNGLKTAIVSDLTTSIQLRKIDGLGISDYIDALVTSEEAGSEKPHPIMFLLALNKLDVNPKEAIMVGDNTVADIEGANFVGLTTILLNKGIMARLPKEDYQKPDYRIKDLKEVKKIMEDLRLKKVMDEGYIKFNCYFQKTRAISKRKIAELNEYRDKLYGIKLVGAYNNKVGYGNLSVRKKEIIITGSATGNYKTLDNTGFSRIDKYDIDKNELHCSGAMKASSESMTHLALYECDTKIHAVIHVHSEKMWKKYVDKLPTTNKRAEYGTPEIAHEIRRLYHETDFKERKIAVLGGHREGLIAFGKDLNEAYEVILKYYKK